MGIEKEVLLLLDDAEKYVKKGHLETGRSLFNLASSAIYRRIDEICPYPKEDSDSVPEMPTIDSSKSTRC